MFDYVGYGLHIRSDLELSGFTEGRGEGLPVVEVVERSVPLDRWRELNDDGLKLAGVAEGVMRFQVEGGGRIVVDPEPGADLDYAKAIVSGELMAALLRQRGLLTLHGSCVATDGGAVGFVGHSGWGKSTLAVHLVSRGYRLLCDDVLAVEFGGGEPAAVPGYPQVKLREDSAARHVEGFGALRAAHAQTDKRLYACAADFQTAAVPLRKIYVLEGEARSEDAVRTLTDQEALVELLRHTRATNLLKSPAFSKAHLFQLRDLLAAVPVRLLHRQMALERLPDLFRIIERDLNEEHPGSGALP